MDKQAMVREFMMTMQPEQVPDKITFPNRFHYLRIRLIDEEANEFAEAETLEDYADALADLLYVVYGAATTAGIDIDPLFEEVHAANMRKLGGYRREDGKWMKPAGWQGPDIISRLREQGYIEENMNGSAG